MKIILGLTLLVLSMSLHAAETSKHEKLVELINVMDMNTMIDSMHSKMEKKMQNLSAQMGVQASEQEIFDKYYNKMLLVMEDSMSWKKMEPLTIEIYDRNFSEKEISDMLTFYKTDTGKAVLVKMPVVMQESVQLGQSLMKDTIPQIQEIVKQLSDELKKSREPKK